MTIKVTHIPKTEHKHGIPFVVMQTPIIIIPPIIKEIPPSRWHFFLLAISFLLSPQIRIIKAPTFQSILCKKFLFSIIHFPGKSLIKGCTVWYICFTTLPSEYNLSNPLFTCCLVCAFNIMLIISSFISVYIFFLKC